MNNDYQENGYILIKGLFSESEIDDIHHVVAEFHELWKKDNQKFYSIKAVNSAYLTSPKYLKNEFRAKLFQFVSSNKIMNAVECTPITNPAFMNTQLFFNPVNSDQKNYWHRDGQYHLTLEEQQQALKGPGKLYTSEFHCSMNLG